MTIWNNCMYLLDSVCRVLLFFCMLYPSARKPNRSRISFLAGLCILVFVYFNIYKLQFPFYFNELIRPAILLAFSLWFYPLNSGYAAFLVLLFTLLTGIWGVVVSPLLLYALRIDNPAFLIIMDFLRFPTINLLRAITIFLVKKKFLSIHSYNTLKLRETIILLLPAAVNHGISVLVYTLSFNSEIHFFITRYAFFFYLFALILVLSSIGLILSTEHYFRSKELEHSIREKNILIEQEHLIYQQNQKNNQRIREIYHDLRNHFNALRALPNEATRQEYLDQLCDSVAPAEQYFNTGNIVLDILLNQKYQLCKEKGIRLYSTIALHNVTFLTQTDICSLFGNALDNAIESAEELPAQAEKLILIKGGQLGGFLSIRITNPLVGTLKLDSQGIPMTTKEGSETHGIGVYSMMSVLNRYHGQMTYTEKDHTVMLTILIPIPDFSA